MDYLDDVNRRKADGKYIVPVFALIIGLITYSFVEKELVNILSDYNGHAYVYLPLLKPSTLKEGLGAVPYCLWHITVLILNKLLMVPFNEAVKLTASIYNIFSYYVAYFAISQFNAFLKSQQSQARDGFLAFCFSIIQGIYINWIDKADRFQGMYSMNPYHNPTHMCMKGFGLLCVLLVIDIWGRQDDLEYKGIFFKVEKGLKKYYVYLAIFLFLSAFAKPTFAEMFIPAVGIIMLIKWIKKLVTKKAAGEYFVACLWTLLCAAPTLLYILAQFLAYFVLGGSYGDGGSLTITAPFEVWSMNTSNVVLGILCGMAFPLFMILVDVEFFFKTNMGQLGIVAYVIGLLEAGFLGESGEKLGHGDFLWPLMAGMLVLWLVSLFRLLQVEKKCDAGRINALKLNAAWFIFMLHAMFGLLYFFA